MVRGSSAARSRAAAARALGDHGDSRAVEPELYTRYLTQFLDSIRTDQSAFLPLPARALTAEETHRAMTRERGIR